MPWIGIVSLVKGSGMSVQEHAAPESISMLANWPPKLALIFIRFPLLIMLPMAMEATYPIGDCNFQSFRSRCGPRHFGRFVF